MSAPTLDDPARTTDPAPRSRMSTSLLDRAVSRVSELLDARTSRRGFLSRVAVVGSAVAVGPTQFLLKPGTAYAAVCGIDATCASGYTVFCATVNNGVNRCPPGSLVGGWWKSDGSGYCCGSARYYIDCHSFCSCGCGGSSRFCGEGCRNCSCGCGPSGQCDQRRVCCNEFRYGQCNQGVSCTGPVWCRVVTCTPPWRIPAWDCSTTSATDQRTGSHSAPGLIDCSAINNLYFALGGQGSFLGEATTGEVTAPDGTGRFTAYDGGSIYWTPQTGAHEVHGAIRATWSALGWESGPVGYPTTDELSAADSRGRYNHFSGTQGMPASIYWSPETGAHAVLGAIRARWEALRWEVGPLGYPTTDELPAADGQGRYNHFSGSLGLPASIYWSPATGAHAVWGEIRQAYERNGFEAGDLGYPTTDELGLPDGRGRYTSFAGKGFPASIYWTPATGAHAVQGLVRAAWKALGFEAGPIGYPLTDELPTADGRGRYNDFTGTRPPGATQPGASIYWSPATGAVSVRGPIRAEWLRRGGTESRLGYPTQEPVEAGPGKVRSRFQGGVAVLDTASGEVTVTLDP